MRKLICLMLVATFACTEIEMTQLDADRAHFIVSHGRLVFKDVNALVTTINTLSSKTEEELTSWERKISGFVSLRTQQIKSGTNMGIESDHQKSMLSIINRDGLYEVSGKLILFRGDTEYSISGASEKDVQRLLDNPIQCGAVVHKIKRVLIDGQTQEGGRTDGVDARYQRQAYRQIDLGIVVPGPSAICNIPPSQSHYIGPPPLRRFKYVFESYIVEYSSYIELGVKVKFEAQNAYVVGVNGGIPIYAYTGLYQASESIQKVASIHVQGFVYNPFFDVWSSPQEFRSNSTNQPLILQFAVPSRCIDNFRIYGSMSIASKDGGTYFCPYKFKVNGPNADEVYANEELWSDINYCPSGHPSSGGGGGGGSGGGSGGGGDCAEGCVWSGIECICP